MEVFPIKNLLYAIEYKFGKEYSLVFFSDGSGKIIIEVNGLEKDNRQFDTIGELLDIIGV